MRSQQRRRAAALAGLPIIAITVLAGCSGGGPSSWSAAVSAPAPAGRAQAGVAGPQSGGQPGTGSAGQPGTGPAGQPSADAQPASTRAIARAGADLVVTAQLTVRAASVTAAVARATAIATAAGGYISSENDSTDPAHPGRSTATMSLEIPAGAYQKTLARLDSGGLGTQLSLRQQARDVTRQVADVSSQVTSDEAAIAQLRTLLTHAGSIADLLSVQNQINAEETGLESMLAQRKALGAETAFATVTVTILGPKRAVPPPRKARPAPPPGLASGLSGGWRAFRLAVDWVLAVIGAIAPFAVAAAIVGSIGYVLRRRSRSA